MNMPQGEQNQWDACPPGELQQMVGRIKVQQRRRFLGQLGAATAGMAVAGVGGYFAVSQLFSPDEYHYGGIACSEVMPLLDDYRDEKLTPPLRQKVSAHLSKCPQCGPHYRRMIS